MRMSRFIVPLSSIIADIPRSLNLDLFTNQMAHGEFVELLRTGGTNIRSLKLPSNATIADTVRDASLHKHHTDAAIASQLPTGGREGDKVVPGSVPTVIGAVESTAQNGHAQPNGALALSVPEPEAPPAA